MNIKKNDKINFFITVNEKVTNQKRTIVFSRI